MNKFVPEELRAKADLYEERNKLYGDNYKRFGKIMALIMQGQKLDVNDADQMNRFGIWVQVIAKVTRYGENFMRGGHDDSLDDIAVYVMMLKELDSEKSKPSNLMSSETIIKSSVIGSCGKVHSWDEWEKCPECTLIDRRNTKR